MYGANLQSVALKEDCADTLNKHVELAFLYVAHIKPENNIHNFYLNVNTADMGNHFEFTACWWTAGQCCDNWYGTSSIETDGLDIILPLIGLKDGTYAALMPFTRDAELINDAVFNAQNSNHLYFCPVVAINCKTARVAVSISKDSHKAINEVFAQIQEALPLQQQPLYNTKTVTQDQTCSLSTYLSYCTWNTFYHDVTHDKLVIALTDIYQQSTETSQPMLAWVIINDSWQMVNV
ncbi:hypothetical protein COEREDRAFT_86779 [Coemansia reversa NRRL 1564]|uniref:Uncharacterized protein n=1 Tax=Coemansia reversa (strain ATCC 12441 / NRRL 1564) TaxID=763665 RepID=A0A2G5BCF6_COERN|nr:hypothetical protein COEREDRAFT_86779 [Coemansia reversa NRRL 1564]|eukprot:PIA16695.1 hypothetical protein COEREDRAFT_86779 [Coemansia reversa NRRL 1564]